MTVAPFLFVAMLAHAFLVVCCFASPKHMEDALGRCILAYAFIMAAWAAGLLLQPKLT